MIWLIWTTSNEKIFRTSLERESLHLLIFQRATQFQASIRTRQSKSTLQIAVRWAPLPQGSTNLILTAQLKAKPTEQGLGELLGMKRKRRPQVLFGLLRPLIV